MCPSGKRDSVNQVYSHQRGSRCRHSVPVESHSERSRERRISSIVTAELVYLPSSDYEGRFVSVAEAVNQPTTKGIGGERCENTVTVGDRKQSNELGLNICVRSISAPCPAGTNPKPAPTSLHTHLDLLLALELHAYPEELRILQFPLSSSLDLLDPLNFLPPT